MNNNKEGVFLSPRLTGKRFEDHSIPLEILEDFSALEELIFTIAKDLYLLENNSKKRVPNSFTSSVEFKLSQIDKGSAIPIFIIASSLMSSNPQNLKYFESARDHVFKLIELAKQPGSIQDIDKKYLSSFNKIGKHLKDDENIEFNNNHKTIVFNRYVRKELLLQKQDRKYSDQLNEYGYISSHDKANHTFHFDKYDDKKRFKCNITEAIKDNMLDAFSRYSDENKPCVLLKGTGIYDNKDKLIEIDEIDSIEIVDPFDVTFRLFQLSQIEDNWYEGHGKSLDKEALNQFDCYFNLYYDFNLPLPAIFPTLEGNIQLEWKNKTKNIILSVDLNNMDSEFLFYDSNDDKQDLEQVFSLNDEDGWKNLNTLINKLN